MCALIEWESRSRFVGFILYIAQFEKDKMLPVMEWAERVNVWVCAFGPKHL